MQTAQELDCPTLLENPWTGNLKNRGLLDHLPMRVVDYCRYGNQNRKRTAVWTNTDWQPAKPLCKYDCHATTVDTATKRKKHVAEWSKMPRDGRAVIPKELCTEIADHFSGASA